MELFSLQSVLLFLSISLYLYFSFFRPPPHIKPTRTPGFRLYPVVGALPDFLRNRHRFLDWMSVVLRSAPTNSVVFWRPGGVRGVITANPAVVEHVLRSRFENYPKGDKLIALLGDFLGKGIFNSDGELWRVQRKTASYEFNTRSLRQFVMRSVTVEIETRLVPILSRAAAEEAGRALDLQDVLERFAFDNICKLAFNVDPGCLAGDGTGEGEFMRAFEDAARISSERFMYAFPLLYRVKRWLNVGSERRLRESIAMVHEFAEEIIRSRMEENREARDEDLLSRFIGHESVHENGSASTEFLRDIVISFILAGRDTTSSALTWFFWLLSHNPEVERKILSELEKLRKQNGRSFGDPYSIEELRDMHYLHAAISEVMRLYPPVPVDTKACLEDDVLPDGTFIGKDWLVTYDTHAMGRMESIWGEDCHEFVPERWIDESGFCRTESPFKYPVFHAGPRMCLGKDMAYIQMKSIAASVLERFEIDVPGRDTCPEHLLSLTLRMKGGLPVRVRKRCVD
ncbi:cytochrome P450 CYP94D108 [Syzygium oleosum]|uniref:cytochrome P450 CYP94D108 n=1 Tax=Syzygium oleosum TaxID=219896 RepID=UPI0024B89855|nr:cytochrome P450 CYP94D108 [Syzygium oleosum]